MGEAELDIYNKAFIITSHFVCYGNAATSELVNYVAEEIETMWNEPHGLVYLHDKPFHVVFRISAELNSAIDMDEVYTNTNPRNNYFRIEEYAHGNISFVDGLGCNTGYFMVENLYQGSTTAAHEYGHTLGLKHPRDLDFRGFGTPRIMYPRGTLVDPEYQYDSTKPPGVKGGTMHPRYRKVFPEDIELLRLEKLKFTNSSAVVGDFSNVFHFDHNDERLGRV